VGKKKVIGTDQLTAEILGLGAEVRSMQELDIAVNAGLAERVAGATFVTPLLR
jgi:hypothetical protein